jgi:hypothetical protein
MDKAGPGQFRCMSSTLILLMLILLTKMTHQLTMEILIQHKALSYLVSNSRWHRWQMPSIGVFCTDKNMVVKIAYSSSEMVLRTTKHIMIYPDSAPSLKVIAIRPVI